MVRMLELQKPQGKVT